MPGPSGTAMVPSGLTSIARIDEVGRVVAAAGGDVAGQREVRQRRQVDVVRAADAALEHAAVPDRDAVRRAQRSCTRIDSACPPTRPGLMLMMRQAPSVDAPRPRPAASAIDSSRQIGVRSRALQRRVIAHVVVVERLLDHHQVEPVERGEVRARPPSV